LLGALRRLVGAVRELDAAGLATATRLDLRLDDDGAAAQLLGGLAGLFRAPRDDPSEHGDPVLLEDVACLVLEQVHPAPPFVGLEFRLAPRAGRPPAMVAAIRGYLHVEICGTPIGRASGRARGWSSVGSVGSSASQQREENSRA